MINESVTLWWVRWMWCVERAYDILTIWKKKIVTEIGRDKKRKMYKFHCEWVNVINVYPTFCSGYRSDVCPRRKWPLIKLNAFELSFISNFSAYVVHYWLTELLLQHAKHLFVCAAFDCGTDLCVLRVISRVHVD